jgi:hypothetical protein
MPTLSIVFTRDANSKNDDKIIIRPDEDQGGGYHVKYIDSQTNVKFEFDSDWINVEKYVDQVLSLLKADEEPFKSVQFMFPGYPVIMVSIEKLSDDGFMENIWNIFESLGGDWPVRYFNAPQQSGDKSGPPSAGDPWNVATHETY